MQHKFDNPVPRAKYPTLYGEPMKQKIFILPPAMIREVNKRGGSAWVRDLIQAAIDAENNSSGNSHESD